MSGFVPAMLCILGGLISLAVIVLLLYVAWWALTKILSAFEIGIPPKVIILLQVIAVLIIVIVVVEAIYSGSFCGFLTWWPGRMR